MVITGSRDIIGRNREAGKQSCGYVSNLIPVEMIYASGMIPIRIDPRHRPKFVDSLLQTYVCEHARGCLEGGLAGDYGDLEGMVFTRTCDAIRNLYTLWVNNVPNGFSYFLSTPGNLGNNAGDYLFEEFKRFGQFLQGQQNITFTVDDLGSAIQLYNRIRDRLRSLTLSGSLSGTDLFHLFQAFHLMDPQEFYDAITGIDLDQISKPPSNVSIAITGSHFSDPGIISAIEALGIHVAILDLDSGPRSFWLDVEEEGDPLKALAERYIKAGAMDPSKHPCDARVGFFLSILKKVKIDGVVVMNQKYCDPYLFEEPFLKRTFEEEGIPSLFITTGERLEQKQQLINRIEAFMEMIL
jgi:benzoyl-CoA reductase subunit C